MMRDFFGVTIEENYCELIMITYCNNRPKEKHCDECPYKLMCLEFQIIHDTIPYGFKKV